MKSDKHLRTEAAMRKAVRLYEKGLVSFTWESSEDMRLEIEAYEVDTGNKIAIFDLRDCYQKRSPLKGITKAVRKAISPKGRR
jgi:hypothetical protein